MKRLVSTIAVCAAAVVLALATFAGCQRQRLICNATSFTGLPDRCDCVRFPDGEVFCQEGR